MRLSLQLEQFIHGERLTTVEVVARRFGLSETRCWAELEELTPYGVHLTSDGRVAVDAEIHPGW